jgi:hypothetical protein
VAPIQLRPFDFMISLYRPHPLKNKVIFSTTIKNAPFQDETLFRKFPLRWQYADCMYYKYMVRQAGMSVTYPREHLFFAGSMGKLKFIKLPMAFCQAVAVPPSLQNCFVQTQRMVFYKKGNSVNNPCKPYCNVFPIFLPEGLCLNIGSSNVKSKLATVSDTPMWRGESGEVFKFSVTNPHHLSDYVANKVRGKRMAAERPLLAPPLPPPAVPHPVPSQEVAVGDRSNSTVSSFLL